MKLTDEGLRNAAPWRQAGIRLPSFDRSAARLACAQAPVWVHFGAGNLFRGFIAALQQRLLNQGLQTAGLVAAETFDFDIIDRIYAPHDALALMATLRSSGETDLEVIASIARGLKASRDFAQDWQALYAAFESQSLQLASFTITEKGYALRDLNGGWLPAAESDVRQGPEGTRHAMGIVASLLLKRFEAGARPIALLSLDNCSRNGEKLRQGVLTLARAWRQSGFVPGAFVDYLEDETRVSFPWSMIDKITPRPSEAVRERLEALGVEDTQPVTTARGTYIAPFVNAEAPQYLVVEDRFPNGRPPLERAGVYMTDRDTVNRSERMKVTTCLNPLHTALAVYGCLLGYPTISAEMQDPDLKRLVERIGAVEGLPVVVNPGILQPEAFLREVIDERLPNPFLPDTPQRIATDTSQKIPIRFGETLKSYMARPDLDAAGLTAIPLTLAGWLRYLLGVDDQGFPMPVSSDPMLEPLEAALAGVRLGDPASARGKLDALLRNDALFGVSLVEAGLARKVEEMFAYMLQGPGAVRAALRHFLAPS